MANLCIIPARGGSKRIPRKNIKEFLGKPIISYSIEAAIRSQLFDVIMVSTDDVEIAEIAMQNGAEVPFFRSAKNSDDHASTMDVLDEVLLAYKFNFGKEFEFICCVYASAPLIHSNHLIVGFEKLKKENLTCVFPMVPFSYPIWRSLAIGDNLELKLNWPEHLKTRSQDLPMSYHDAGQWYWFATKKIHNWDWPNNSGTVILSEEEVQDIDSPSDWELAKLKFNLLNQQK